MIIGIDLDGVVFDTEKEFRVYSELYDMLDLKQNSKKDNREIKFQDRFDWKKEDIDGFIKKYLKQIIIEANYLPGAQRVLKLLKEDGHTLILITARGGLDKQMIEITKERFTKENMKIFDKYYWAIENKDEVCLKEKVDIMIDDSYLKCNSVANSKIKTIYLKDAPSYELEENGYIKTLYNWGEIYRYIKEIEDNEYINRN